MEEEQAGAISVLMEMTVVQVVVVAIRGLTEGRPLKGIVAVVLAMAVPESDQIKSQEVLEAVVLEELVHGMEQEVWASHTRSLAHL